MRENRDAPLALTIQDKLDNQGFLTSKELNPFILRAILEVMKQEPQKSGILVDGFPRNIEQLDSWCNWPFSEEVPLEDALHANTKPDVVLSLRINKQNAKSRYSARARDSNDSDEKFERRFAEYETETLPVEHTYRQRGLLIDVSSHNIYMNSSLTDQDRCERNQGRKRHRDDREAQQQRFMAKGRNRGPNGNAISAQIPIIRSCTIQVCCGNSNRD